MRNLTIVFNLIVFLVFPILLWLFYKVEYSCRMQPMPLLGFIFLFAPSPGNIKSFLNNRIWCNGTLLVYSSTSREFREHNLGFYDVKYYRTSKRLERSIGRKEIPNLLKIFCNFERIWISNAVDGHQMLYPYQSVDRCQERRGEGFEGAGVISSFGSLNETFGRSSQREHRIILRKLIEQFPSKVAFIQWTPQQSLICPKMNFIAFAQNTSPKSIYSNSIIANIS